MISYTQTPRVYKKCKTNRSNIAIAHVIKKAGYEVRTKQLNKLTVANTLTV